MVVEDAGPAAFMVVLCLRREFVFSRTALYWLYVDGSSDSSLCSCWLSASYAFKTRAYRGQAERVRGEGEGQRCSERSGK